MCLGLDAEEVEPIFKDQVTEEDAAFRTLKIWANREGSAATVGRIKQVLGIGFYDEDLGDIGHSKVDLADILQGKSDTGKYRPTL